MVHMFGTTVLFYFVQHKAKEQTTGITIILIVLSVTDALICWWISLINLSIKIILTCDDYYL